MLLPDPADRMTVEELETDAWVFQSVDMTQYSWQEIMALSGLYVFLQMFSDKNTQNRVYYSIVKVPLYNIEADIFFFFFFFYFQGRLPSVVRILLF